MAKVKTKRMNEKKKTSGTTPHPAPIRVPFFSIHISSESDVQLIGAAVVTLVALVVVPLTRYETPSVMAKKILKTVNSYEIYQTHFFSYIS